MPDTAWHTAWPSEPQAASAARWSAMAAVGLQTLAQYFAPVASSLSAQCAGGGAAQRDGHYLELALSLS